MHEMGLDLGLGPIVHMETNTACFFLTLAGFAEHTLGMQTYAGHTATEK